MVEIFESGDKLSDQTIKLFESFLEINLPKSYKSFLKSSNGGYPELNCFNFFGEDSGSSIHYFYGINADPDYDIVKDLKVYKDRVPSDCLPIAYDEGGNLICLILKGSEREKIYFWDHEFEKGDGEEPDFSNMTLIANNFDEFINSLYELEI